MDPQLIRQALGLPEDATDEQVHEALVSNGLTTAAAPSTSEEKPAAPVAELPTSKQEPVSQPAAAREMELPPGTVLVDASVLEEIRSSGKAAVAVVEKDRKRTIKDEVTAAIADGRIPPARRAHWEAYLENDLEGGITVLSSLETGMVPVEERGHAGTSTDPATHGAQIDDEAVTALTHQVFPEVARRHAAEQAAAAAGVPVPRQRISSDTSRR